MVTVTIRMVGASNADAKETIHSMEKRQTALMMRGLIMDTPARSMNNDTSTVDGPIRKRMARRTKTHQRNTG